jgi:alcohol dehydrogenase class IV
MKLAFDISTSGRTILGAGTVQNLGSILTQYGFKNIAVLMDNGIETSGIGQKVVDIIEKANISCIVVNDLAREPGVPDVDIVMGKVKAAKPDCVVSVGGGSVLDVGKLCGVLTKARIGIMDLLDGAPVPTHTTFTIAIPTTAGTGSESTKNAIIAIPSRNSKGAVVDEKLLPDLVILDPELTLSLPSSISATTGMDALCHAMECYLSQKANTYSDLLALDAMTRIARSLRKAVNVGSDIEARGDMLLASYFAGMCITLSGTNAVHAMSYPLGVKYHIPHGQSNAMLLPYVMEYNLSAMPEKTRTVAECFGYDTTNSKEQAETYLIKELHTLLEDLNIGTSLTAFGAKYTDLEDLVNSAYTNRRLMDNNPVELNEEQIGDIYLRLLGSQE